MFVVMFREISVQHIFLKLCLSKNSDQDVLIEKISG